MRLELSQTALRDLQKLSQVAQKQIVRKLAFFLDQPKPLTFAVKLTNFSKGGSYRFRVGQYRIVFDVAGDLILILYIEHRREVYRKR